ncbi:Alpha/Beta hydrolase protein [Mycena polygramma]|nr:Alpha/Beta hydrolase protein [Mycena polygramma]
MISLTSTFLLSALLLPNSRAQTPAAFSWDQVPLDYSNPSVGTAALAVIRLPANGPILYNPGGPGGSGVDALIAAGSSFQAILGDPRYDFVSFDPRGVHYSTPIASFFKTEAERVLWYTGGLPISLNASSNAIPQAWARAQLLGTLTAQRDDTQILKYLTTDNVARDMKLITEKFGFEKLKYYGVSYGSVLGATFAAMFPDNVERLIIDGVVDADAWFNTNLTIEATDADKALQSFFDGCAAAGPDLCAFYEPTAAAIADRLETLVESVRAQPVPAITPVAYGIVDYSLLRYTIFETLYSPYALFPLLAQGLADLEKGNGTALYSILTTIPAFECECNQTSVFSPIDDSTTAISCGDAVQVTDSIDQLAAFYQNAGKLSQFAEFLVGSDRINCAGWKVYRDDRLKGPVGGNTSFPLLLISNTADPVTPRAGALNTQAGFPGSVLLTQNSTGHVSVSAPSLCTLGYIREYFLNGTLPAPGTVCQVDATLFEPAANSTAKRATLNENDERVLAASRVIRDSMLPVIMRKRRNGY